MDTWEMIKSERASLISALADMSPEDWSKQSLCDKWTVRDVVAKLVKAQG